MSALIKAFSVALLLPGVDGALGFDPDVDLDSNGCVKSYDATVDYFPPERRAMMGDTAGIVTEDSVLAEDFSITYHRTYKVLRNLRTQADNEATRKNDPTAVTKASAWILRQCGTPEEYPGLPADLQANVEDETAWRLIGHPNIPAEHRGTNDPRAAVFVVPVQKWSTGSTVPISFLEELGLGPRAVVLDPTYMSSSCGQKLVTCDAVHGLKPGTAEWKSAISSKGSQLHLTDAYNTGCSQPTGPYTCEYSHIDVAFDASSDPGMLNRAEWLKFVAAFFNKEPEANHVFSEIMSRFNVIVGDVNEALRIDDSVQPVTAFIKPATSGSWPSKASISNSAYLHEVIHKAGGKNIDYVFVKTKCPLNAGTRAGTRFECPDAATMKEVLLTCDVVFDDTYPAGGNYPLYTYANFKAMFELTTELDSYPFLKSMRVFRTDKRLSTFYDGTFGNDYLESAIPHADEFLLDMASVLSPAKIFRSHKKRFVRNLAIGETTVVVDGSACVDPYAVCPDLAAPQALSPIFNYCRSGVSQGPQNECTSYLVSHIPKPEWSVEATNAGWNPPCADADGSKRRLEVIQQRKMSLAHATRRRMANPPSNDD